MTFSRPHSRICAVADVCSQTELSRPKNYSLVFETGLGDCPLPGYVNCRLLRAVCAANELRARFPGDARCPQRSWIGRSLSFYPSVRGPSSAFAKPTMIQPVSKRIVCSQRPALSSVMSQEDSTTASSMVVRRMPGYHWRCHSHWYFNQSTCFWSRLILQM